MNKRTFLKNSALLGLGSIAGFSALSKTADDFIQLPATGGAANDEDFWASVRGMYKLKPDYINLENGYYCIQPQEILTQYLKHIMDVNLQGAYYMRTVQFDNKHAAAKRVAEVAGVSPEELVITRNTTELRAQVASANFLYLVVLKKLLYH